MVSGYNEKLVVLLKVVLDKVKDLEVQEDRFNVLKEQVSRTQPKCYRCALPNLRSVRSSDKSMRTWLWTNPTIRPTTMHDTSCHRKPGLQQRSLQSLMVRPLSLEL